MWKDIILNYREEVAKFWEENNFFQQIDHSKEKFYCLEMFPYPSGNPYGSCQKLYIGDVLPDLKVYKVITSSIQWAGTYLECRENAARQNNLDPKT